MASLSRSTLQHRVWRWHFFAGLMIIPFAVILAVTGATYLFKPQVEGIIEQSINAKASAPTTKTVEADDIVLAAQASFPGSAFHSLTLPKSETDRSYEVELRADGDAYILWVDKHSGDILRQTKKSHRIMEFTKKIHGTLLGGKLGSYVVEFMASWMIVLIISGIYLWWPRGQTWWRVFVPRLSKTPNREKFRRIHGAVGMWIGSVVLLLLLSGLPWTQLWGKGFDNVQSLMQWNSPGQEWFVTLKSSRPAPHQTQKDGLNLWEKNDGDSGNVTLQSSPINASTTPVSLQKIVKIVKRQGFTNPIEIKPPRGENGVWTVRSMTPNRPHRETVHYDKWSADEVMRIRFSDYHPVKRAASYGIAFHEGALFGWLNQLIALLAALGVIALSITGGIMWWKRKPIGHMGVPPMPANKRLSKGLVTLILILAVFLPMVGISLVIAFILDQIWSRIT